MEIQRHTGDISNFVSMKLKSILKYFLNEMISYDVLTPLNILISVFEAAELVGPEKLREKISRKIVPHPSDIYRTDVKSKGRKSAGLRLS